MRLISPQILSADTLGQILSGRYSRATDTLRMYVAEVRARRYVVLANGQYLLGNKIRASRPRQRGTVAANGGTGGVSASKASRPTAAGKAASSKLPGKGAARHKSSLDTGRLFELLNLRRESNC